MTVDPPWDAVEPVPDMGAFLGDSLEGDYLGYLPCCFPVTDDDIFGVAVFGVESLGAFLAVFIVVFAR